MTSSPAIPTVHLEGNDDRGPLSLGKMSCASCSSGWKAYRFPNISRPVCATAIPRYKQTCKSGAACTAGSTAKCCWRHSSTPRCSAPKDEK